MKINADKIIFEFRDKCPICGKTADNAFGLTSDIVSILDSGTPTCEFCEADLELMDKCEVSLTPPCPLYVNPIKSCTDLAKRTKELENKK